MVICIPQGWGVPVPIGAQLYDWSGPPIWWDSSGPISSENQSLEDPRWVGSAGFGYPQVSSVATDHALFRAVYTRDPATAITYLYLSWVVKVDPDIGHPTDDVLVGFYRPGMAAGPVGLRIIPTDSPVLKNGDVPQPGDVYVFRGNKAAVGWTWT